MLISKSCAVSSRLGYRERDEIADKRWLQRERLRVNQGEENVLMEIKNGAPIARLEETMTSSQSIASRNRSKLGVQCSSHQFPRFELRVEEENQNLHRAAVVLTRGTWQPRFTAGKDHSAPEGVGPAGLRCH